jgi:hypothetical protein
MNVGADAHMKDGGSNEQFKVSQICMLCLSSSICKIYQKYCNFFFQMNKIFDIII